MALPLKYNTASQTIILGPFLDDTDGKTAETGLSIANTDIKLAKHNATSFANKNSGGATHIANGYYYCTLDATDTNTLGRLVIAVNMSGALPVWHEFEVISAQEFDAFYGSSYAQVDVRQIAGSAVSTTTAQIGVNVVNVAGTAQTARDLGAQLDATISSRAAAATALSNTTWTDTRAGYLDNLTRLVGTIAAGTHNPQSGDAYAVVSDATYGNAQIKGYVDDLESRLTATRAGYLDNLSGGAVALNADVQTLLTRIIGTLASGTHHPQSGDAYAVVTNGTYGNSALKSAIDTVDSVVDLIEDIVRNKMEVTDSTGTVTLYEDNSTTVKFSVTNCLTDDSTKTTRKRLE